MEPAVNWGTIPMEINHIKKTQSKLYPTQTKGTNVIIYQQLSILLFVIPFFSPPSQVWVPGIDEKRKIISICMFLLINKHLLFYPICNNWLFSYYEHILCLYTICIFVSP